MAELASSPSAPRNDANPGKAASADIEYYCTHRPVNLPIWPGLTPSSVPAWTQRSTLLLKSDGPPGTRTGGRLRRVITEGPDSKLDGTDGADSAVGGAGAPPSCGGAA
jgi:hypothetical protein